VPLFRQYRPPGAGPAQCYTKIFSPKHRFRFIIKAVTVRERATRRCVIGFWGGLFGGQNETLNQNINQSGQVGAFATGLGESSLKQSNKFWQSILSGNSAKTGQVLAPEISAQQKQVQQGEKTAAEFGNRGGGVNSATQAAQGQARGNIVNLVGSLQSGAASSLAEQGSGLLSQGLQGIGMQAGLSQERLNNWKNSILGQGLQYGAGYAEGFGLGKM